MSILKRDDAVQDRLFNKEKQTFRHDFRVSRASKVKYKLFFFTAYARCFSLDVASAANEDSDFTANTFLGWVGFVAMNLAWPILL